ncbi:MAG: hypothetical protein MRERV_43c017 [Mycoplasmataceae bacterium RV_VA103A]|nr:MAG: hypothetical protein MRERV_43c017 [Mycoplasmataceae bacterium RV_VA103A]
MERPTSQSGTEQSRVGENGSRSVVGRVGVLVRLVKAEDYLCSSYIRYKKEKRNK